MSGTKNYNINLASLIGYFSHIFIIVRAASSITTALSNDPGAYVAVSKFSIKNAAGSIVPAGIETDAAWNLLYQSNYNFSGDGTDINSGLAGTPKNVYSIVFSEQPEAGHSKGLATGGYQFSGLGEVLNIQFASALSANHVVDIVGFKYVILNTSAAGALKKIEI